MRRRLPLLRAVSLLIAAFVITGVGLLGFVRVPRMVAVLGRLAADQAQAPDTLRTGAPEADVPPVPNRFECVVDSLDYPSVRPGQSAAIRLDAYPWMQKGTLSARVAAVDPTPLAGGGYAVILAVDPESPPGPLLDGLHGEARIATGETESLGRLLFARMGRGSF